MIEVVALEDMFCSGDKVKGESFPVSEAMAKMLVGMKLVKVKKQTKKTTGE